MPRTLSHEHHLELERRFRVARVFGEFWDSRGALPPEQGLRAALQRTYDARDLRGMRLAEADLLAMSAAATVAERRALESLLRERSGVSLDDLMERHLAKIRRLQVRGRLTSEEQYCMVRERVEFIAGDPERLSEYHQLAGMLTAYEERAARRG